MTLSHKVRQTSPHSPLILSRRNLFPPSKCSNSFQLSCCCCHCYWLSIRHGVIKEWRRNCLGSAVALIALSEPSGRLFIKGGHEGDRGGGWRCPPDKSVHAGSHCLVQPGSTRVPQFRVGTWQAPLSNRAVCTRPQTSLLPRLILHCCPCQGLFVYPWSPLYPHHTILFPTMPNYPPSLFFFLFFFLTYSAYFPTSFIKLENCAVWIWNIAFIFLCFLYFPAHAAVYRSRHSNLGK